MPKRKDPKPCTCGPLAPQDGDQKIEDGTGADQILAQVLLLCDNDTGVFFFRHKRKLYLRIVETE